jgi:hypothetical protein
MLDRLRSDITAAILPLQTTRAVDIGAFDALVSTIERILVESKSAESLSKALLKELNFTRKVVRNEAVHHKTHRAFLEQLADKLDFYFDLLLLSETPDQRKPGVPRIT